MAYHWEYVRRLEWDCVELLAILGLLFVPRDDILGDTLQLLFRERNCTLQK